MADHAQIAKALASTAEDHAGDAQTGDYAAACAAVGQVHAILAVADAISELTRLLGNGHWEADAHR